MWRRKGESEGKKEKEKQEWRGGREIEIAIRRWRQQNQTMFHLRLDDLVSLDLC